MFSVKRKIAALLVAVCMASSLMLTACGGGGSDSNDGGNVVDNIADSLATLVSGDVTGEVGVEYETKWFNFTIESMEVTSSYGDYTAAEGYSLLVAHINETNISGAEQPFGTFDWYITTDTMSESDYIFPMSPLNENMMEDSFYLEDGEGVSADIVIEFPSDLTGGYLTYIEIDSEGSTYATFRIPIN